MDWQRIGILGAMAVVTLLLITEWGEFQDRNRPVVSQETLIDNQPTTPSSVELPENSEVAQSSDDIPSGQTQSASVEISEQPSNQRLIEVKTDTLLVLIDTQGGDLVKVALLDQKESLDTPDSPLILLNQTRSTTYIAQSGIIGANATDTAAGRPQFTTQQTSYELDDSEATLQVDLTLSSDDDDVVITKRFTFERGSHLVTMTYLIDNQSDSTWSGSLFGQIKRDSHNPVTTEGLGMAPFLGAAITTEETHYQKIDFDDLSDIDTIRQGGIKASVQGGWVAMVQHYFLSAWIPSPDQTNHYTLRKGQSDIYLLGFTSPPLEVMPGTQGSMSARFYAGPKDIDVLEAISPYLDLTVDYGWLWWIAKPLFHVLNFIYGLLGSWGWSIIALTVLIKLAFFHLSATSYKSMAKMRKFAPEMQRMKDLYGDDRQKMSQEMMKLYKKEKINPLSGCLPILVQMPVFISLYWVLMESVQLRHTPFLGWIEDLSVKDPYFILPVIMGVTMYIQQKLNPTPPDPTQAKVMQMLPLVFTFMFMWFPAGLVLYWVVNNTLSIAQQYVITRQIESGDKA